MIVSMYRILRSYSELIVLAHNKSPELQHFANTSVHFSTFIADMVDIIKDGHSPLIRTDIRPNKCEPVHQRKSIFYIAYTALNKLNTIKKL